MKFDISGIQEAQEANLKTIAALRPRSVFGEAIKGAMIEAHRYAVQITHVISGALKASHRMEMKGGLRGRIFVDPNSPSPRSNGAGTKPAEYAVYEHARGGSHAFYGRTVSEHGHKSAAVGAEILLRGLPQ